jgi:hypothetical protein
MPPDLIFIICAFRSGDVRIFSKSEGLKERKKWETPV